MSSLPARTSSPGSSRPALGLIGYGAFGCLIARHLAQHFRVHAYDPAPAPGREIAGHQTGDQQTGDIVRASLPEAAGCPIVVLATPVAAIAEVVAAIRPHLHPGVLVLDVGSVKMVAARAMADGLPAHAAIVATHPLFGPQSARNGVRGAKIAVCEVRGGRASRVAAFLRRAFGLDVIRTTPEAHDRDAAAIQGLTHMIARVMVEMGPLPTRMTTPSFERLMQAVEMVRYDAPEVFDAIERANPFAADIRRRFVAQATRLAGDLAVAEHAGREARAA